jgi:hypothetical protein
MYAVNEGKIAAEKEMRAREIITLNSQTGQAVIDEANIAAVRQRSQSLRYTKERRQLDITNEIISQQNGINSIQAAYRTEKEDELDRVNHKREAEESLESGKAVDLRESLKKDLRMLRADFDSQLSYLRAEHQLEFKKTEEELDLRMRLDMMRTEENRNSHFNLLLQTQANSLKEFRDYFRSALGDCEGEIVKIDREISRMVAIKQQNSEEVKRLSEENSNASSPIEKLENVKSRLVEEIEIVKGGKMALNNFRKSIEVLERDLKETQTKIALQKALIVTEQT